MTKPTSSHRNGKGNRIPGVNTKALREGLEHINWTKRLCHLCHKPVTQDDLDSLRAGYATPANRTTPVPYHFACFNPS